MNPFNYHDQQLSLYLLCVVTYLIEWIVLPFFTLHVNFVVNILPIAVSVWFYKHEWARIYFGCITLGGVANFSHRALIAVKIDPLYFGLHRSIFYFMMLLSLFHMLEFVCITLAKFRKGVKFCNYLLNPSDDYYYQLTLVAVVIEFLLGSYFFPGFKYLVCNYTIYVGLSVAIVGDCIRKAAILQAGDSFNHVIQEKNSVNNHHLVTTGIYSWCRHPSYIGWSLFAIGLQIMVGNIISLAFSIVIIYFFFRDRIEYEEGLLLSEYQNQYRDYMKKTPLGFPFVS